MSDTMESLRRKIASAGDLQSVVRTMKALAAASIGQYERSVQALADYTQTVEQGLGACFRADGPLSMNEGGRLRSSTVGAVVFGSDQGLVGQFNEVVADYATERLAGRAHGDEVWAVGERVHARLSSAGMPPTKLLRVPTSVAGIGPLVGQILVEAEVAELHLFYNCPSAGSIYAPVTQRLLPLDDSWRRTLVEVPWPTHTRPEVLGGETATLRALIREYLFISLYRACAESLASENASRLAAMQRADKNIDTLLEQLNGSFHRVRQSSIDEELFDVISSVEALSSASGTSH